MWRTWVLLRPYIAKPVRRMLTLAVTAAVAGVLEAVVLVIVVNVATAFTRGDNGVPVQFPSIEFRADVDTLLWIAAASAIGLFVLHAITAWIQTSLSTDVLKSARNRAVAAYLQASWPIQAMEREGRLQETVGTHSIQSTLVCLWVAVAATASLNLAALLAMAFLVDPVTMLIVMALGALLFVAVRPVSRITSRAASRFVAANTEFSEDVSRAAAMAMEVRLFGVQDQLSRKLMEQNALVSVEQRRSRFASLEGVTLYRDSAVLSLVAAVAALDLAGDHVAQIGAVVLIVVRALAHATLLQSTLQGVNEHAPNLFVLDATLRRLEGASEKFGHRRPEQLGDIEVIDVTYRYERGDEALRGITLRICQGETLGIVGPSGSGKSTLLQVILRLRRPTTGSVVAAGGRYEEIDPVRWSALVALVPQEPKLMEATVEENLRFMRPGISREEIERAADAAHVGDEIRSLPSGFDTALGPRGSGLSGGQKQRLAIARALLGKPEVLLLDEPTSALDSQSEERLRETLISLKGKVTIVVVAHRVSTLDVCDRLVVLRHGAVEDNEWSNAATPSSGIGGRPADDAFGQAAEW